MPVRSKVKKDQIGKPTIYSEQGKVDRYVTQNMPGLKPRSEMTNPNPTALGSM